MGQAIAWSLMDQTGVIALTGFRSNEGWKPSETTRPKAFALRLCGFGEDTGSNFISTSRLGDICFWIQTKIVGGMQVKGLNPPTLNGSSPRRC